MFFSFQPKSKGIFEMLNKLLSIKGYPLESYPEIIALWSVKNDLSKRIISSSL